MSFLNAINFELSKEKPERVDIMSVAKQELDRLEIINSLEISERVISELQVSSILSQVHPQKHIDSIEKSAKAETVAYPIKAIVTNFAKIIADGEISYFAMRPPGHHSYDGGVNKDDKIDNANDVGEGFCYYNNVALASLYAARKFDKKSIMIIDWDYHHGNGTLQSCLFEANKDTIKARYPDLNIYFLSLHNACIYPYTEDEELAPDNYGTIWESTKL